MAFLVALGKLRGGEEERAGDERTEGMRNTREERHDQKRWMDEGNAAEGGVSGGEGKGAGGWQRLG